MFSALEITGLFFVAPRSHLYSKKASFEAASLREARSVLQCWGIVCMLGSEGLCMLGSGGLCVLGSGGLATCTKVVHVNSPPGFPGPPVFGLAFSVRVR